MWASAAVRGGDSAIAMFGARARGRRGGDQAARRAGAGCRARGRRGRRPGRRGSTRARRRDTPWRWRSDCSMVSEHRTGSPHAGPARGGAPRGAHAAARARRVRRPGAPARAGSALRTAIEAGAAALDDPLRPARAPARRRSRGSSPSRDAAFEELCAVQAGRPEVRAVLDRAQRAPPGRRRPTIFFLDEIHRFNKAQQDALLPAVEEGLVTLIGRDDREPVLRGQLGAALAHAALRAGGAERRGRRRAAAPRRSSAGECGEARRRRRRRVPRRPRAAATRAPRWPRWSSPCETARRDGA